MYTEKKETPSSLRKGILHISLSLFSLFLVLSFFSDKCFSEENDRYFEIGFGLGKNIPNEQANHYLLAPALNWKLKDYMRLRLEADIEKIEHEGKETWVLGMAPFIRFLIPGEHIRPFAEIGLGGNYISRNEIEGSKLGCQFVFSMMGGAGLEFSIHDIPLSLSYRYRHLSNGSLCQPNQGHDAKLIMFTIGITQF